MCIWTSSHLFWSDETISDLCKSFLNHPIVHPHLYSKFQKIHISCKSREYLIYIRIANIIYGRYQISDNFRLWNLYLSVIWAKSNTMDTEIILELFVSCILIFLLRIKIFSKCGFGKTTKRKAVGPESKLIVIWINARIFKTTN